MQVFDDSRAIGKREVMAKEVLPVLAQQHTGNHVVELVDPERVAERRIVRHASAPAQDVPVEPAIFSEAIEVASTAVQKAKGLLGRDCLEDGQGLLFRPAASLHTFFMQFPIDIIYADKAGKVLKLAPCVRPFKLVAAPLRSFYALELPDGAIERSGTRVGDHLSLAFEEIAEPVSV